MLTLRSLSLTLVGLCTGAVAADAELVARDLFISLDAQPTDFTFTTDGAVGSRSGDDAFDNGFGLSLGGRWSFTPTGSSVGLVIGGDLDVTQYTYENSAQNLAVGARLIFGGGWAITDRWELLLEPTFEFGYATFSFPQTKAYDDFTADGTFLGYGARVNLVYRVSDQWAVMGAMGWKHIKSDLSGDDLDLTIEQEGLTFSVGVLYRLSAAPTRVE